MDEREFMTMVDETVPVDERQYPTLDDWSAVIAVVNAPAAKPIPPPPPAPNPSSDPGCFVASVPEIRKQVRTAGESAIQEQVRAAVAASLPERVSIPARLPDRVAYCWATTAVDGPHGRIEPGVALDVRKLTEVEKRLLVTTGARFSDSYWST